MHKLAIEMRDLESQKVKFENSREEAQQAYLKQKLKAEKEIQLRLFFEQKVNALFRAKADTEAKLKLLQEKFDSSQSLITEKEEEVKKQHLEILELRQYKASAIETFK